MALALLESCQWNQHLQVQLPRSVLVCVATTGCGRIADWWGRHLQQAAGVDEGRLPREQLGAQPLELALVLAQQRALVHVLVEPRRVLDVLGPVGELERRQRLCGICIAAVKG